VRFAALPAPNRSLQALDSAEDRREDEILDEAYYCAANPDADPRVVRRQLRAKRVRTRSPAPRPCTLRDPGIVVSDGPGSKPIDIPFPPDRRVFAQYDDTPWGWMEQQRAIMDHHKNPYLTAIEKRKERQEKREIDEARQMWREYQLALVQESIAQAKSPEDHPSQRSWLGTLLALIAPSTRRDTSACNAQDR